MTKTQYISHGVSLYEGQKMALARAVKGKEPLRIGLDYRKLSGNDRLMLTRTQIKGLKRVHDKKKGISLRISKTQVRKVLPEGSSILSSIILMVMKIASKVLLILGMSSLARAAKAGTKKLIGSSCGCDSYIV